MSADGNAVLLSSNRVANNLDVYRASRDTTGFAAPIAIDSLNSAGDDYAVFTPDELQAFVGSSRPGTLGSLDLYYARRTRTTDPFPEPTPLAGLNTDLADSPTWVSPDGCSLYFKRSTRPYGVYRMLVASRPK